MPSDLHGLLAEFDSAERLREAVRKMRGHGYRSLDAFSPFPVEGLAGELGQRRTGIASSMLVGGLLGGGGAYFMQYLANQLYPLNVGGRPLHSWPAFIPITFELTVLCAALCGAVAMVIGNGLPRLHHPLFNVKRFERASIDAFFLCVEASDERFGADTRIHLERAGAQEIWEVPA